MNKNKETTENQENEYKLPMSIYNGDYFFAFCMLLVVLFFVGGMIFHL
jgi:hypothetical protein